MSRVSNLQPKNLPGGSGFTLIELMIVIVIVAVLLAVALPSYQSSIQKGRRADAKSALLDAANRQEGYMLDRGTYSETMTDLGFDADPYISKEEHYSVTADTCVGGALKNCYILTATPRPDSPQADDTRCTSFMLDSKGAKTQTPVGALDCW